jgi:signal transduction histidine kinase
MYPQDARSLKHELRTPVNHIIGYSALLLEAAEELGDEPLAHQAAEMQAIGSEMNRAIESTLLSFGNTIGPEQILNIRDAVNPLILRIVGNLSCNSVGDAPCESDLRRIGSAADRLQSLLDLSIPARNGVTHVEGAS